MLTNYSDLPDGQHVGIISSHSWMPPSAGKDALSGWFASAVPSCHLLPASFKGSACLCRWRLGITGMTTMLSHSTRPWETRWVTLRFVGWVWYMLLQHTWALKEMSARLWRRWWQTLRWIPTHRLGEINEFLEETFSLLGFLLLLPSKLSVPVLIFSHVLILALALWVFCSSLPHIAIHSSLAFSVLTPLRASIHLCHTAYKIILGRVIVT